MSKKLETIANGGLVITVPEAEECNESKILGESNGFVAMALWYPQMGGYCSKAVAVAGWDGCVDVYVWHDGEFPFCGWENAPKVIHHCDPDQFIELGHTLNGLLKVQGGRKF